MSTQHHQLSREMFASLASGGGGPAAIQELIATEHSAHMLLLAGVVTAARDGEQSRLARKGFDVLIAAWQVNPAAVEKVVRHPSVSVWARRVIQGCRVGPAAPGATPAGLGAVAAVAAIRAGLAAEIELPVSGGRVMLPALGAAQATGDTVRICTTGTGRAEIGAVEVPHDPSQDAPGWRGLARIRAGRLDVLVDDLDPFRMPDLPDLASGVDAGSWGRALREAWRVLESHHPALATEVAAIISVVVPRSSPPSGVVSTSSPHAFGAVGMSLPPDPVTGAETFAHEIQHLKLGAVQKIVALTLPDDGTRYYAPWRDDPRPLNGLLQGTYAYLGVAGFWRRQRRLPGVHRQADAEYARWRAATARSTDTLRSSGRLTPAGADFACGMAGVLAAWEGEAVPASAQAYARRAAEAHMTRWQSVNGRLPAR
jgi:HEXXH motif-containing protein